MFITSLTLVIIGALNWLLVGLLQFDLVAWAFGGQDSPIAKVIYVLVGVAGLVCIGLYKLIMDHGSNDA